MGGAMNGAVPILLAACVAVGIILAVMALPAEKYGPELRESALVEDLPFVPAGHGSGSGLSMKGDVTFTSVDIPARYATVFQCQHGKFVIEGEALWKSLTKGERVTVVYREKLDRHNRAIDLDFLRVERP